MLQWCRRRLMSETRLCFARRDFVRLRTSAGLRVCHKGGVRSVERGDGVTSLSRSALSRSRRYFRGISRSIGFFKGAFLLDYFSNGPAVDLSFFYRTRRRLSLGRQTRAKRRARRHHTSCHASDRRPSFPEALVRPFSGPRARAAARVGAAAPRPRTSAGVRRRRRRASRAPPPCPGPRRGTRRTRKAGCPGRGSCGNSTTP